MSTCSGRVRTSRLTVGSGPDNTRHEMYADRMSADRRWWWHPSSEWALVA